MTVPQWIMVGWLVATTLAQLLCIYKEPSGKEAFVRIVGAIFFEIGPIALALYLAGFWS